jgi:2-iminoacetate synthase
MTIARVELESRPDGVPEGTAAADVLAVDFDRLLAVVDSAGDADVRRALDAGRRRTLDDFAALLSTPAQSRLEELAAAAHRATVQRFGRTIHLFAPLYLSNECVSTCTYCGFSAEHEIARRTLSVDEVVAEGRALWERGFRHVLLVAALAPMFPSISLEVQVWDAATYGRLVEAGCDGLVVYQETYSRPTYAGVHLKGKKRNFDWRLAAPDRGAAAGMRRLGVGALLGLHDDWRFEALAVAAHASALMRRWWRAEVTVSLPRLRPAAGVSVADVVGSGGDVDDPSFVQLLCALRLFLPDAGVVLSTREPAGLRDALVRLGVTHMSAGSHTEPGGYAAPSDAEPQFSVSDTRSAAELAAVLRGAGYDPVWKDWERA